MDLWHRQKTDSQTLINGLIGSNALTGQVEFRTSSADVSINLGPDIQPVSQLHNS
jgi:hypothetical protein